MRINTIPVRIGTVTIGGGNPIAVQSMCNTDTKNIVATVKQISGLKDLGCELVRLAVTDLKAAEAFGKIKRLVDIPLIACVQFDHRLALAAIKQGADKVRITPGNIGSKSELTQVVVAAKNADIPIRIGVNSGSLPNGLVEKYGYEKIDLAMVENALEYVRFFESLDFNKIVISLKSTNILHTIRAYRSITELVNYPLHIGITEAGSKFVGSIKSAIGLGILLEQGIGDTVRVSLTDSPIEEVKAAWEILKALELRNRGVSIVSCPTCGRTQIDIIKLTKNVEELTSDIAMPLKICLMGCIVNGIGESKNSDIGIVGGRGKAVVYRQGKRIKVVSENEIIGAIVEQIEILTTEPRILKTQ